MEFCLDGLMANSGYLQPRVALDAQVPPRRRKLKPRLPRMLREETHDDLRDPELLARVLQNMKDAFGGFVDLGLIEADGTQVSYAGPFELEGRHYEDYPWFQEVIRRGVYVSDVFLIVR